MRALLLVLLAAACAGSRPSPRASLAACDALSFIGAATPAAIASDSAGSLAVAGTFRGELRAWDASVQSTAGSDAFLLRLAGDGRVRWLRRFGGAGDDTATAVALLPGGDALIAGLAAGRCFLVRAAASDGHTVWTQSLDAPESTCSAIAVDAQGTPWVAGSFSGSLLGLARARGARDAFVARLDVATGSLTLARGFGGDGTTSARALAITSDGSIVAAGSFTARTDQSTFDFGRGNVAPAGGSDAFVVSLAPDGKLRWVSTFGDNLDDAVIGLQPDGAAVVAAGTWGENNPAGGHHAAGSPIAARIGADGRGDWVQIVGPARRLELRGLAQDDAGRYWMAGSEPETGIFASAFSPHDGTPLGARAWSPPGRAVATGLARIPGGLAVIGLTSGELQVCDRPVGSPGEWTGFVAWLRDL